MIGRHMQTALGSSRSIVHIPKNQPTVCDQSKLALDGVIWLSSMVAYLHSLLTQVAGSGHWRLPSPSPQLGKEDIEGGRLEYICHHFKIDLDIL